MRTRSVRPADATVRRLFPADLPDEAAACLCIFLHNLSVCADDFYFNQRLRTQLARQPDQLDLFETHQPWLQPLPRAKRGFEKA